MRRSIVRFVLPVLAAVFVTVTGDGHGAAQGLTPLRVSTTPIDLGAEALYADDLGYFRDAGLDVDVTVLANGAAVAAAVASGAEDIGEANLVSLASAHSNGIPFVVIAPAGNYTSKAPTTVMVTAKSSPLRTAKELDGKTIGVVGIKDITQIGASAWIDKTGGNLASVKFTEIPQSAMCTAITSGRIDAGVVSEPFLSIALAGEPHGSGFRSGRCRKRRLRRPENSRVECQNHDRPIRNLLPRDRSDGDAGSERLQLGIPVRASLGPSGRDKRTRPCGDLSSAWARPV